MINLKTHPLFQKLDLLNLENNEYVIMGSGIMFALEIRDLNDLNDLDLLVTKKAWDRIKSLAKINYDKSWKCEYLYLFNNQIEIWNGWGPGEYIPEEIIKNSQKLGGYNFSCLEDVIKWKTEMGREKDKMHIEINKYLEKQTCEKPSN